MYPLTYLQLDVQVQEPAIPEQGVHVGRPPVVVLQVHVRWSFVFVHCASQDRAHFSSQPFQFERLIGILVKRISQMVCVLKHSE